MTAKKDRQCLCMGRDGQEDSAPSSRYTTLRMNDQYPTTIEIYNNTELTLLANPSCSNPSTSSAPAHAQRTRQSWKRSNGSWACRPLPLVPRQDRLSARRLDLDLDRATTATNFKPICLHNPKRAARNA
jgi:hypothetical protein